MTRLAPVFRENGI